MIIFVCFEQLEVGRIGNLEDKAMHLFNQYMQGVLKIAENLTRIKMTGLPKYERFCSCATRVLSGESNDESNQVQGNLFYRNDSVQMDLQTKDIDLLLVENHPCLNRDLSRLYKCFKCKKFHQNVSTMCKLSHHLQNCPKRGIISRQDESTHQATHFLKFSKLCPMLTSPKILLYKLFVTIDFEALLKTKPREGKQTETHAELTPTRMIASLKQKYGTQSPTHSCLCWTLPKRDNVLICRKLVG